MSLAPYHPQVVAESNQGEVLVDQGLKEVLEWSWSQGIETEYSCQGEGKERAYIMFSNAASAELFLQKVSELSEVLRSRVHSTEPYTSDRQKNWQLVAFPKDKLCDSWGDPRCTSGPVKTCIRIALRMPANELDLIKSVLLKTV